MDVATIIGLLMGSGLVIWAMLSGSSIDAFYDGPSVAIVLGGAVGTSLISFPLKNVLKILSVVKHTLFSKATDLTALIKQLVHFAEIARRDGILSLENSTKDIKDPFLVNGIQMAVDGTDPELIEQILTGELESISDRHADGKAMFDGIAKYAPAFGMIGTLIGLVKMLQAMDDPSKIGAGMAVALLTTMYGALLANLVAMPLADKLGQRSREELFAKSIIVRGVMSIQSGDNPRVVEQKLKSFLPLGMRAAIEKEAA